MSSINLMPWREHLRQQQKQQYFAILALLAVVMFGIMYGIAGMVDKLIANQQSRNQFIEQQIKVLDVQIAKIKDIRERKTAIEQRMALIEQLQTSRNVAPQVLDELARVVPPGVAFRSLSRQGNNIKVLGISESNNRLADFMRRLENSKVFINGELSSIVADTSATDAVSEFQITFAISPNVAPDFSASVEAAK